MSAALEVAARVRFDAVVSDIGLPDGTGIELMTSLHAAYGLRGIALSGYGMEEDLRRSREAGFVTHLVKPVDFTQLRRSLVQLAASSSREAATAWVSKGLPLTPPRPLAYSRAVFRLLHVAMTALFCLPVRAAGPVDDRKSPPPPPAVSTIYSCQEAHALVDQFEENPAVTRRMVDRLVQAVTGQPDTAAAWKSLVAPTDRVGIKVAASGGRYFGSHRGIVEAVVAGLEQAGVPRHRIIVWDRDIDDLRSAGYVRQRGGYEVANVPPASGYDRTAAFSAPVLGRLIWGDATFAEKQSKLGKKLVEADQLSSNSYIATVLNKQITKVINVPVLSDEAGCGVAGAIYNMTVPNIDNWRRFTRTEGDAAGGLLDLYADERVGAKVVLTIMDALLAQYAGGPRFNPNYAFAFHTIYASKSPVALDANAYRDRGWRKQAAAAHRQAGRMAEDGRPWGWAFRGEQDRIEDGWA